MEIKTSVSDIPLQNPPGEEFSAADLTWTKFATSEDHADDVALIPYGRVEAFISGECNNPEFPTRFHIERGRKRERGSLKEYKSDDFLLYRMYWCSFGPENYGEGGSPLPSRRYRLNTRNRAARPQSMRGCTCHFTVKRLYAQPSVALIIYHERQHVNKSGFVCHGPLDRDAIGPGAKKLPYVCSEIQQQTMSLMYLGIPEENVLQTHIEGIQRYCGLDERVDLLASQYVQKLGMIIKRSTHELDLDDLASIRMWVERNKKSVFFYQDSTELDPFILGIQTEWQLQQMFRFGHQSLLACDSSFGISKLKYPLYTLLVFDSRNHALPVAWIITRSIAKHDVIKWMKALVDRVQASDASWRAGSFIIDDPASELDPIRELFACPILFSLWRIRRSWLKNVLKRCVNREVQCEIFRRLGEVMYSIWSEKADPMAILEEMFQDFVDQTVFVQYFKSFWVPKIGMWLESIKNLPLSSQESWAAIEGYHLKLKLKTYNDSSLNSLQRVDWLVHKLTTELHSSFWLDLYSDESGSFPEVKEAYVNSTSWSRALNISNSSVVFVHDIAKVLSQKDDGTSYHTIWNPGSEFSICDCKWALQGNLCKHVIKVNMVFQEKMEASSSLSYQSFQRVIDEILKKPVDNSVSLDLAMAWVAQVQEKVVRMTEFATSGDVASVADGLLMKWGGKKGRSFVGKPSDGAIFLPSIGSAQRGGGSKKKNRKRRRITRLTVCQW
ncbi:SWIM zinc finger family protein [Rhynchospora pubera]|uniref:SWIM zinc finger family protein n=1 Tax=Rhynchospora pubera TaxID=906938 RepID=A0AAV8CP80_9POAL|nr:SWIM zinc finger family protein [Rhynchospora pubera]